MRNQAAHRQFVVSTFKSDQLVGSQVWDTHAPLGLGYPFRFVLDRTEDGIRVRDISGRLGTVTKVQMRTLSNAALTQVKEGAMLEVSPGYSIQIRPVTRINYQPNISDCIGSEEMDDSLERGLFRKALLGAIGSLALVVIVSSVMPRSKVSDELIPVQFAKIVMTPKLKSAGSASAQAQAEKKDASGAKNTNLVQAFQSKSLKKSMDSLLKGGMTSLLKQSDLLAGKGSKAAVNNLFAAKATGRAESPMTALQNLKNVNVGALGGGSGKAGGVGYGKGEYASVDGQGKGFVSLDTSDSAVEEGLSKEEVGRVIHSHMSEIRYCYESSMIRNPNVEGKFMSDFVINGSGNVKSAAIKDSSVGDAGLEQCVLSRLFKWKFPNPKGGVNVAVSYPFIFKTLGR